MIAPPQDHHQLQPFSQVRENDGGKHHSRSLMGRCISGGKKHEFLDTQYRMHPSLSQVAPFFRCSRL